jgi:hypothetical protein
MTNDYWQMLQVSQFGAVGCSPSGIDEDFSGSNTVQAHFRFWSTVILLLPVSLHIKFYSRIWKTDCTLPFWSAMFFITSGTDQNTGSEQNIYMRLSSHSCQNTFPAHWIKSLLLPALEYTTPGSECRLCLKYMFTFPTLDTIMSHTLFYKLL